ncbi:MAG: electron transfer flavoprotein subunit beta/FixA family protein [Armatimonadetes bacterium]|nr:electron transfer flavoprotein subunit beta/FixA family protein [Armatimonadota bacterium]
MKLIVCLKQVPDTTDVKIDPQTNTLKREGVRSIINPFDLYALEEGIKLKEKYSGVVIAVTMGPPQAKYALEEALAIGVDQVFLLSDRAFAGSDTLATSYIISQAIKKIGKFNLIICGKQATDGDTAQVGPGIAAYLNLPQITFVRKIEEINEKFITAERLTEEGYDVIKSKLPCLITVVKEINTPRHPSLKGKIKAKRTKITAYDSKELNCDLIRTGLRGSPTSVDKIFTPPVRPAGEILPANSENIKKIAKIINKEIEIKKICP